MTDDIPMWAKERVCELTNTDGSNYSPTSFGMECMTTSIGEAFARYIATKEEPPVDPLLIEARKIAAERTKFPAYADTYLNGENDEHFYLQGLLAALRRGMEMAKCGVELAK